MRFIILMCLLVTLGELRAPAAGEVEFTGGAAAPEAPLCLWYRQPAANWEEALPLGNGFLGAMVFGGLPTEHIQFNEHTLWTGQPYSYPHPGASKALPEMHRLLFEGRRLELQGMEKRREAGQLEAANNKLEASAKQNEVQVLLRAARARQKEAEVLGLKEFMSEPLRQKAYQPCGDLWIDFGRQDRVAEFRR